MIAEALREYYALPKAKTMGAAVDAIVALHENLYPGSKVHRAEVSKSEKLTDKWQVEVEASHFSVRLLYFVEVSS